MRKAESRELPWSWERSLGWQGQWQRVKRWRRRLVALQGSEDLHEVFDTTLAFFIHCYHLKDWLKWAHSISARDVEKLIEEKESLKISADIANLAKHYDLTKPPRMKRQLSFAREYVGPGRGWFGKDWVLLVLADGKKHDVLDLASQCETEWDKFVENLQFVPRQE